MSNKRISVNKLAEYIVTSSPARRKKIIKDAKDPAPYITTRYSKVRSGLKNYFLSGGDEQILIDQLESLSNSKPETNFQITDKKNSVLALKKFLEHDQRIVLNLECAKFPANNKRFVIEGLEISVSPDLLFIEKDEVLGAVKFHIVKESLSLEAQKITCIILKKYLDFVYEIDVNRSACVSIDIFSNSMVVCPAAFKRHMDSVESACEEIAERWDKL